MANNPIVLSVIAGVVALAASQYLSKPFAVSPKASTAIPAAADRRAELYADARGHYHTLAEIDHQLVKVVVDTGASIVALTSQDADKLGLRPKPGDFRVPMATANGTAYAAQVQLRSVKIGTVEVQYAEAVVMPAGALGETLLGMSFLGKLGGFEFSKGRLILKQ